MTLLPRARRRLRRPRTLLAVGVLALAVFGAGCIPDPPPPAPGEVCDPPATSTATAVSVMGRCPRVSVEQMAMWFEKKTSSPYRASAPLRDLIAIFFEEGNAEGVRGDIAFIQGIVESGWFNFPGRVPPTANNFSGFGATDGTAEYGVFPDARTGVRAQIQHLRAYADPTATACTVPPLHNPCVDPRFGFVSPKGKAPTWNQFGNGNWATSTTYATSILNLYSDLLAKYGLPLS